MTQPVQKTKQAPSLRRGFLAASLAYMLIFAASALPITLYSEYKLTIGLTDADVSTAMVFYLVGVLGILFFAGRISDAIGRRTTTALGCALDAAVATGMLKEEDIPSIVRRRTVYHTNPDRVALYNDKYAAYQSLNNRLGYDETV